LVSPANSRQGASVPCTVQGTRDKQKCVCTSSWAALSRHPLISVQVSQDNFSQRRITVPEIKANSGLITQINVFTVKPENQQALIDLLIDSARSVCHLPGWKSSSIHRGLDGKTVVNYAQSTDMESQQRIVASLRENGFLDRNKQLGSGLPKAVPILFGVGYRQAFGKRVQSDPLRLCLRYTLNLKNRMSPSFTTYSLPSERSRPASFTACSLPRRKRSSHA